MSYFGILKSVQKYAEEVTQEKTEEDVSETREMILLRTLQTLVIEDRLEGCAVGLGGLSSIVMVKL